jgi:DNA (cytosine-5)-methyltransferase 1
MQSGEWRCATVFYNEIDAYAAAWLRNLAAAGHLPAGHVDERSILDLEPDDLAGYRQCHFFSGLGGWPYALRLAGWNHTRPVWTGSCPCQPFSSAGKQSGSADDRHLWPAWLRLIRECRPDTIFGEQVEGAVGFGWLDRVFADLEAEGYACGAQVLGAHSVRAPHIRQRLFWVADATGQRVRGRSRDDRNKAAEVPREIRQQRLWSDDSASGATGGLADAADSRRLGSGDDHTKHAASRPLERSNPQHDRDTSQRCALEGADGGLADAGSVNLPASPLEGGQAVVATEPGGAEHRGAGGLADAERDERWADIARRRSQGRVADIGSSSRLGDTQATGYEIGARFAEMDEPSARQGSEQADAVLDAWSDAVWLPCLDGKARRVEPGIFPLADGVSARVGRLRAYGNAVVPQAAAEFIKAFLEK